MTFADMLATDRDSVFLNTDEFAVTFDRWAGGFGGTLIAGLKGVLDLDREQGSNQQDGDGPIPETKRGERIRTTATLYYSATVGFDDRDVYLIAGERWSARRRLASDGAMIAVAVVKTTRIATQTPRLKW